MAIVLDSVNKKLEIVLSGAVAANQLPFVVGYADYIGATPAFTPGANDGVTNNAVAVTLVAAPAANTQRMISSISVWNKDTASATVTIQLDNGGTDREIIPVVLEAGDSLHYTGEEWFVLSGGGGRRVVQAVHNHSSNAEGGAMLGPLAVTATNEGLHLLDTNASHDLVIKPGSDLTADRILTLTTGDAARTITLSGNPALADWFDQAVKQASSPTFVGLTLSGDAQVAGRVCKAQGYDNTVDSSNAVCTGVNVAANEMYLVCFDQHHSTAIEYHHVYLVSRAAGGPSLATLIGGGGGFFSLSLLVGGHVDEICIISSSGTNRYCYWSVTKIGG